MSTTEHTGTAISERDPESIWAEICEPTRWPEWNASVAELVLDGPFVTGTTGRLTPPGGNPLPFWLAAVEQGNAYTSETEIASTVTLRSTTKIGNRDGRTVITQHSELVGAAAEYFADSFGDALITGVETTVGRLAEGTR